MTDEQAVPENPEEDLEENKITESNERVDKFENRLDRLSRKLGQEAKEREKVEDAFLKTQTELETAKKERDFFASFSDSVGKYPEAASFKDAIKEKVLAGYSTEDATLAILAKEGKLGQLTVERETPAGGSAATSPPPSGDKSLDQMTREEKREAVLKAINEGAIALR